MAPRVLFYDIETSPNIGYVWGKWKQDVIEYVSEWYVMCVAYKWSDDSTIHYCGQNSFPKYYRENPDCDYKVIKTLWNLFDKADMIVAHNGDSFDRKKANARFLAHGMTPPSPYKSVDTLKCARQQFKFNSNKLGDLAGQLGLGHKAVTGGFQLWKKCLAGDPAAWHRMETYARRDVLLLEKVYDRLKPWFKTHPNFGLFNDDKVVCPNCGGDRLIYRGFAYTNVCKFRRFVCKDCGKWSRANKKLPGGPGVV